MCGCNKNKNRAFGKPRPNLTPGTTRRTVRQGLTNVAPAPETMTFTPVIPSVPDPIAEAAAKARIEKLKKDSIARNRGLL